MKVKIIENMDSFHLTQRNINLHFSRPTFSKMSSPNYQVLFITSTVPQPSFLYRYEFTYIDMNLYLFKIFHYFFYSSNFQ